MNSLEVIRGPDWYSRHYSVSFRQIPIDRLQSRELPVWSCSSSAILLKEGLFLLAPVEGEGVALWQPALIPQTRVNWLHYSPHDPKRAQRAKLEPFWVDFTLYWEHRKIIIEIDGSSHFSEIFDIDGTGRIRYEPSMGKYTEHLRKDRWLRSKGWEVWRFSEDEMLEKSFDISAVLEEMKIRVR